MSRGRTCWCKTCAGKPSHLDDLAAELVVSKVDIIVCGGSQATRAAMAQTKTIPIVTLSSDPVAVGFVASLAKPGGNVTGVSLLAPEVAGKRLALFKELIPSIARVAVLWNPDDPTVHLSLEATREAAARLALTSVRKRLCSCRRRSTTDAPSASWSLLSAGVCPRSISTIGR